MRVFSVPASVPFLRSVIAALVDGRLVDGFEARAHPERLAQATLYLPTRRAGRMAREIFLDELNTDAVLLPRIVALGDIDEDELGIRGGTRTIWRRSPIGYSAKTRRIWTAGSRWQNWWRCGRRVRSRRRLSSAVRLRRWRWPAIWRG